MGTMELLLFLLLVVGLPVAVLLAAGIWLVRQNRSDAHHLVGVVFIVLGLLSLLALVIGVVLVSEFLMVDTIKSNGWEPIPPTVIPRPSPTPTSGG